MSYIPSRWIEAIEGRLLLSAVQPQHMPKKALPTPHVVLAPAAAPSRNYAPPKKGADTGKPSLGSYEVDLQPDGGGEDADNGGDVLAYPGPTELPIGITGPVKSNLSVIGGAWKSAGPAPIQDGQVPGNGPVSGRIVAIAAHPTDPNTIYLAGAGGGVWKTIDGGATWTPMTDGQITTVMGSLAIAPSNPNIIYAGTGEANNSIDSFYGQGILKSTDAGATWTLMGGSTFFRHTIGRIVVNPIDPNTVYAMVSGGGSNGFGGSTGIYKSTDGGTTWTNKTTSIATNVTYSDLLLDPNNPTTLFCAVGSFGGNAKNGLYESTDGGDSWNQVTTFPATGTTAGRIALAMAPSNSQIIYASADNPSTSGVLGVYKSTDGGASWSTITPSANYMGSQGWYDQTIDVNPTDANTVYVAGASGGNAVMRTSDGGATWTVISTGASGNNGPHADHHAAAFDASGRYLDGNDGGIWRLDNATAGQIAWTDLNANLQITQFISVGVSNTDATLAYGGSQDNGTSELSAGSWNQIDGGDGGDVVISPNAPFRVYHIAPVGSFGRSNYFSRSDNGGASFSGKVNGIGTSDPTDFYPPFVVDTNSYGGFDRLLLGTNRVYESTDNAENWTPISTPNTAGWTSTSNIDALAVAPSDVNTIYAAAGGNIFVTTNRGTTWTMVSIPGASDHIQQIAVDPTNSQVAYAVRDRFGSGGKIFHTINGGASWSNISTGLPDIPAYSVALDANGPGTADDVIYLGMDNGVYVSSNLGASWNQLGTGLPATQVHELHLNQQNVLSAGTYGRGMWQIKVGPDVDNVAAVQDGNEIHLTWADNDPGGGSGYVIDRSTDGGSFVALTNIGTLAQTTFTDTTTSAGTSYQYQVQMQLSGSLSAPATSNSLLLQATGDIDHVSGFFNTSDLTLNGAKALSNGNLQFTDSVNSEARTAFLTLGSGPITNFYTEFNFQFTNPSADALTFTLQSISPTMVGRAGGDMAFGGITHSIAIFFNMYSNVSQTGLFTNGSTSGTRFSISGNPFHVADASGKTDVFHVTLSYSAAARQLTETLTDTGNAADNFSKTYSLDLAATLADSSAYAGFTGSTGGLNSTQQVLNWWWSPTGGHPPFQLNGTANADTIVLKADADNIDYWLNTPTTNAPTGKFANTFSGVDIHGAGGSDQITLDESAGDVLLGQSSIDDVGGSASVTLLGSTGNDTYLMDSTGTHLTYANNGASLSSGKLLNLANVANLSFTGNDGNDTITTAGPTPFTLVLGHSGSENATILSGVVTITFPSDNDALTIDNIAGDVTVQEADDNSANAPTRPNVIASKPAIVRPAISRPAKRATVLKSHPLTSLHRTGAHS